MLSGTDSDARDVLVRLTLDGEDYRVRSPLDDIEAIRAAIKGVQAAQGVTWHDLDGGGYLIVNWRATGSAVVTPA